MGNANSSTDPNVQRQAQKLDGQVEKLFSVIDSFADKDPQHVLARCGAETRELLANEVALYAQYSDMVDRHRQRAASKQAAYNAARDTTVHHMLALKELYRVALVEFMIATETGMTLFPLVANNLLDIADIIDVHLKRVQATTNALVAVIDRGVKKGVVQNNRIRQEMQERMARLTHASDVVRRKMEGAGQELQDTIANVAPPPGEG